MSSDRERCLAAALRRAEEAANGPAAAAALVEPVAVPAPVEPVAVPALVEPVAVPAPEASSCTTVATVALAQQPQMLCVSRQDFFLLIQQMAPTFLGKSGVMRSPLPEVPATSSQESAATAPPLMGSGASSPPLMGSGAISPPRVESQSPDVLIMDSPLSTVRFSRSLSPDHSWMFDEDPAPVMEPVSAKSQPHYPNLCGGASSSGFSDCFNRKARSPPPDLSDSTRPSTYKKYDTWKARSPSPSFFKASRPSTSNSQSFKKCETQGRKSRSPSPKFFNARPSTSSSQSYKGESYRRKSKSPSPSFNKASRLGTIGSSESFKCDTSRRPSYSGEARPSTSRSQSSKKCENYRRKSRTPSRTYFEAQPSTSGSQSDRQCESCGKKSRSPFSSSKARPSCSSSCSYKKCETSRRKSRTPSPSYLHEASRPSTSHFVQKSKKSRSPSPDFFNDFEPESRSQSPTFSFLRGHSSSATSMLRSRGQKADKERSLSPDFAPCCSKKHKDSSGPDYSPGAKKPTAKQAPKKRGRPPKNKNGSGSKGPVKCPVCKENTNAPWVVTKCGHYFHTDCLNNWVSTPGQSARELKVCPSCGQDFLMAEVNPIYFGF